MRCRTRTQRNRDAFTILELMIVVALIAIVVAVALPSLQHSRKAASSTQAIGLLKTTVAISEQYYVRFGEYANTETDFVNAGLMPDYNNNSNAGYSFAYTSTPSSWTMTANPKDPGVTGDNYYFVDQSGVIRFDSAAVADATSTPVD